MVLAIANEQAFVTDTFVIDIAEHVDAVHLERRPMDPARGLAQFRAELALIALQ
jgi:hypothetical protein